MAGTEIVAMVDLPTGITPDVLVKRMEVWQDLQTKLLTADDFQKFKLKDGSEKVFKKRSAWRKLALAFNISDEIVKEDKEVVPSGSPDVRVTDEVIWRIYVKAIAPNGRYAYGVGACSSKEKKFLTEKGAERIVHDVFATAHTRAKNRAISDLLGAGEVSAEEITPDEKNEEEKSMSELCSKITTILELPIRNGLVAVSEDNAYVLVKEAKELKQDQQDNLDKILEQFHPFRDVSAKTWKLPKA